MSRKESTAVWPDINDVESLIFCIDRFYLSLIHWMVCSPVLLLPQKRKPPRKLEWTWLWWSGLETWSWPTTRELITNSLRLLTNLSWPDLFNAEPGARRENSFDLTSQRPVPHLFCPHDPFYNRCPRLSRVDRPGSVSFCIGRQIGPLSFVRPDLLDASPTIRSEGFKWEITLNGWFQQPGTNEICHFSLPPGFLCLDAPS